MNLALFDEACYHCCRFSRLFHPTGGNVLCVGVGGSGKQSLVRLACAVVGATQWSMSDAMTTDPTQLREVLRRAMFKAGVKGEMQVLLANETYLLHDDLLADLNEMLHQGDVTDMFGPEEKEEVLRKITPEARAALVPDNKDCIWDYFVSKTRKLFRIVLCCSPGAKLRTWCRRFPGLLTATNIVWFHPWPVAAMDSVAESLLAQRLELSAEELQFAVKGLTHIHTATLEQVQAGGSRSGVSLHITPKMFIDSIGLFVAQYQKRIGKLKGTKWRYEEGLARLVQAQTDTVDMQSVLADHQVVAEEKKVAAENLLLKLTAERSVVQVENSKAEVEEFRAAAIQTEVAQQSADCEEDLAAAEPTLRQAEEALNTLNKQNLTELKSFKAPPADVQSVMACVVILFSDGAARTRNWMAGTKLMARVDQFLIQLKEFKKESIADSCIQQLKPYLSHPNFSGDAIVVKSMAAAGLCEWVRNIVEYHKIYWYVKPKRDLVDGARGRLAEATAKVNKSRAYVDALKDQLKELQDQFDQAEADRQQSIDDVARSQLRLSLAKRLVLALDTENERWAEEIVTADQRLAYVLGDSLVTSGFLCYSGGFAFSDRLELIQTRWIPRLQQLGLKLEVKDCEDPSTMLSTSSNRAHWHNEGLPTDPASGQNACILLNARKVPLLVDPQLQGSSWLMSHFSNGPIGGGSGDNFDDGNHDELPFSAASPAENFPGVPRPVMPKLRNLRGGDASLSKNIKLCIALGEVALVELPDDNIDPILHPILAFQARRGGIGEAAALESNVKAAPVGMSMPSTAAAAGGGGRAEDVIVLEEQDLFVHPNFCLILYTRAPRPTFGPETQSEVQLINFSVTPEGLSEQLLSLVIDHERADVGEEIKAAVHQINYFKIEIQSLEDELLGSLSGSTEGLLEVSVVESTEKLKVTAKEVQAKIRRTEDTQQELRILMESYRPVATRGSTLFFLLSELHRVEDMYQYSLQWFVETFHRALSGEGLQPAEGVPGSKSTLKKDNNNNNANVMVDEPENVDSIVKSIVESVTLLLFNVARRGVFERHKMTLAVLVALGVVEQQGRAPPSHIRFLLSGEGEAAPSSLGAASTQPQWLNPDAWRRILVLSDSVEGFGRLAYEIEGSSKRWRDWADSAQPETERIPGEWKSMGDVVMMLVIRAIRPDRFVLAAQRFISSTLGSAFLEAPSVVLSEVAKELSPTVPLLYLLFPGADPAREIEAMSKKQGFSAQFGTFHNIALGEGQEQPALTAMQHCASRGGWVLLQNLHLMSATWLTELNRLLETEILQVNWAHRDFRLFFTAEPTTNPNRRIPSRVIQRSLKVVSEPPQGLRSSMRRCFTCFSNDMLEGSSRSAEFKTMLYSLCFFHSVMVGRIKYGRMGFSKPYAFSQGDLTISATVIFNYFESHTHDVPWEDMKTLVGEIMYGGHVTDIWDRRVSAAYLSKFFSEDLLGESFELSAGVPVPPPAHYSQYLASIDELETETPTTYGLTSCAEVQSANVLCNVICDNIRTTKVFHSAINADVVLTRHRTDGAASNHSAGTGHSAEAQCKEVIDDLSGRIIDITNLETMVAGVFVSTNPYSIVLQQEYQRLKDLWTVVKDTMAELLQGLKGRISMSPDLELMQSELEDFSVPECWQKHAYPSHKPLRAWVDDFNDRIRHLENWASENGNLPRSLWIGGLFNPQVVPTAVLQSTARKLGASLDSMVIVNEVTKKVDVDTVTAPREGIHVHGIYLDQCRWDLQSGSLAELMPREERAMLPVLHLRAVTEQSLGIGGRSGGRQPQQAATGSGGGSGDPSSLLGTIYTCPVYYTSMRGTSYVMPLDLRCGGSNVVNPKQPRDWTLAGACALLSAE